MHPLTTPVIEHDEAKNVLVRIGSQHSFVPGQWLSDNGRKLHLVIYSLGRAINDGTILAPIAVLPNRPLNVSSRNDN